jgi:carboxymethylenebutenolidase
VRESTELVRTPDGEMPTVVVHPEHPGRSWPTVIWLMDGRSIRPALREMASRLATSGYCVVLPYLFYRSGPYREFTSSAEDIEVRDRCIAALSSDLVVSDVATLLSWTAGLPASSDGPVGVLGYCMSGAWALAAAREFPDRVAAAASVHGGRLVTDGEDSPHRNLKGIRASVYVCWADDDPTAPADGVPVMRDALAQAGVDGDVELMVGARHGFTAPDNVKYDRNAAERHWERLHALFQGLSDGGNGTQVPSMRRAEPAQDGG